MKRQDLLQAVERISKQAGAAIMDVYTRDAAIQVSNKADNSPLTDADLAAHKIIVRELKQLTPEWPILSEESVEIDWQTRKKWSTYWLVDPLDGTREFINRNGEFTVNIALIENNIPVLGTVYVPVNKTLYSGGIGLGAYKEFDDAVNPIQVKKTKAGESVKVVASRNHRGETLDSWLKKLEEHFAKVELLSMGSSLKICLVAEGKADIYPRLAPTSEWDTAAAQAILEAAGGELKDVDFRVYRYNRKENILNPFFYAIGDVNFNWRQFKATDVRALPAWDKNVT